MSLKAPCFNCEDRHQGCHSNCESYINWKRETDKRNDYIKSERKKAAKIKDDEIYRIHNMKRGKR